MQHAEFIEFEEKTYREYHSDGHIEFFVGIGSIVAGLGAVFDWNELLIPVIIALIVVPLTFWKEKFVIPRLGQVQFRPETIKSETRRFIIAIIAFFAGFIAATAFLFHFEKNFRIWFEAKDAGVMFFISCVITFCYIGIAYARKVNRHYLFALVNVVVCTFLLVRNIDFAYMFLANGACLVLVGGYMIYRFFTTHPKLEHPLEEPVPPEVSIEFEKSSRFEKSLYEYYLSDGSFEFMASIFYLMIGLQFWKGSVKLITVFLCGMLFFVLWKLVFARAKIGKENYQIVRKMEKAVYSPLINVVTLIPFFMIMMLSDHIPKQMVAVYNSNIDLLMVGWLSVALVFDAKRYPLPKYTPLLLSTAIIYIVLHAYHVPGLTNAIIVASLSALIGMFNAFHFFRSTPPRPLEQS